MELQDALNQLDELAEQLVKGAVSIHASKMGLDDRCGYLMVGEDFIATRHDRTLQYYGGFEYVDAEYRHVMGSWVFYDIEHERVAEHHENALENTEEN